MDPVLCLPECMHRSKVKSRDAVSFEKWISIKIYYHWPGLHYMPYLTQPFYV